MTRGVWPALAIAVPLGVLVGVSLDASPAEPTPQQTPARSATMRPGAKIPVTGMAIHSAQVDLTAYASDAVIAPGNRVTLAVAVTPHADIHVYAPGAKNYRVVKLSIDKQPFVRTTPVKYPASEIYFFKPLNERVPVYRQPFTVLESTVLEGSAQARAALKGKTRFTMTGTLEYQACDEGTCFNPVTVPLSWTFTLRALVTP